MASKIKSKLIKLLILLSLTRWYNILLTMIAQYLAAFFVFNNRQNFKETFQDMNLHLIVLCTALLLAAGYIINFFYDREVDLINYPKRTQLFLKLNKEFLLRTYFIMVAVGLILAFVASWKIGVFFFCFGFMLWFYSHKLKRIPYIREISATLLTIASFFSITLHYGWLSQEMFLYGWLMFFIVLIREGFKDIEKIKGNAVYSYYSLRLLEDPIKFRNILHVLAWSTLIPLGLFIYFMGIAHISTIAMCLVWLLLMAAIFTIQVKVNKRYAALGNNLLKLSIIIAILGVVWL